MATATAHVAEVVSGEANGLAPPPPPPRPHFLVKLLELFILLSLAAATVAIGSVVFKYHERLVERTLVWASACCEYGRHRTSHAVSGSNCSVLRFN